MYHTLDDLLYNVNRVAQMPTVNDLREPVTRNLISVYKKIDSPSLWQGAVDHYSGQGIASVKLNPYCMVPLDLAAGKHSWQSFTQAGKFVGHESSAVPGWQIPYIQSGDLLFFKSLGHNNDTTRSRPTDFTLSYWRIPLDGQGVPLVDDRIWDAAVLFCQAEESRIMLNRRNSQSFAAVPYQVNSSLANRAIDEARAFCNKMTPNQWSTFWTAIQINRPG